jgi:signal transduction histidine kinase
MRAAYGFYDDEESRRLIIPLQTGENKIPELYVDEMMIEQSINNLVANAFKYSHPISNVLLNSGEITDKNGALFLFISITSYGTHIPDGEKNKIFEMGYRYLSIRKKKSAKKGAGLGLHVTRRLVRRHGGDVFLAESTRISDFNVPLLYMNHIDTELKTSIPRTLSLRYARAFSEHRSNGEVKEVVNMQYSRSSEMYLTFPDVGFFRANINEPTYKNTFTLTLPIN